jgi:hypothetical protein
VPQYFGVSDEMAKMRKSLLYQHVLDLSVKLAKFITEHYCPKAMDSDSIYDFYMYSSVIVNSILESVELVDKLRELNMLDKVKEKILGKNVDPRTFRMYVPTLADMTRLVWLSYHDFVGECVIEERMIEMAEEGETAGEKTASKTGKKAGEKTKKKPKKEKGKG